MNLIESLIQENIWLGMNNIKNGKVPTTWPFDGTPVNYQRWDTKNGYPVDNNEKTSLIVGVIQPERLSKKVKASRKLISNLQII